MQHYVYLSREIETHKQTINVKKRDQKFIYTPN